MRHPPSVTRNTIIAHRRSIPVILRQNADLQSPLCSFLLDVKAATGLCSEELASGDASAGPRPSNASRFPLPPGRCLPCLRSARSAVAGSARSQFPCWVCRASRTLGNSGPPDTSLLQVGVFSPRRLCGRLTLVVFLVPVHEAKISAAGSAFHLCGDAMSFSFVREKGVVSRGVWWLFWT